MGVIETTIRLNDAFSGTLRKLESGLNAGSSGFDKLKGALNGGNMFGNATRQSNGFFKSMVGAQVVGSTISKGMALAGNGIRSMVGELNESTVAWDTFDGNMRQIGKTPAQIASARASMQQFAQATIYSSSDMASTYSQLAAIGTKNTGQLVKGFAGLAASATDPKQAMKTLSEQATQMAAKPMVQWQDLKLMMEQAPAGMSAVAKKMHMTTAQLISSSQGKNSTLKSADLLKAIAEVGTNANFSKMATQYKTVGQAADGLRETLANKLQPQFKEFSQIGIDAISKLSDKLSNMNFDKLADKALNAFHTIKAAFDDVIAGFKSTGALSAVSDMFHDISTTIGSIMAKASSGGGNNFFTQLGSFAGGVVSGAANAIDGIARAIGELDPNSLKILGTAFIVLKSGMKGLVFTGVVAGLSAINKLDPNQIQQLSKAIQAFAISLIAIKAVSGSIGMLSSIGSTISKSGEAFTGLQTAASGIADFGSAIGSKFLTAFAFAGSSADKGIKGIGKVIRTGFMGIRGNGIKGSISNLVGGIGNSLKTGFTGVMDKAIQGNLGASLMGTLGSLKTSIGGALSSLVTAVGGPIVVITGIIIAAVWAWKSNLLGFHDFISNIFSNLGTIFEPLRQAIGNLGNALAPVGQVLGVLGGIVVGLLVNAFYLLAIAIGAVVDALTIVIDIVSGVVFAFRALYDAVDMAVQAFRDFFSGNWSLSNAKNALNDFKSDLSSMAGSFGKIGDAWSNGVTSNVLGAMSQIGHQAKTTQSDLNGIKVPNIAQNNASVFNMNNVAANKAALNKKVKVGYTFDTNPAGLKNAQNQITGQSVKTKVTPDMSKIGNLQQQVQSKMSNKPIKVKVATPKVPTPKVPKMKTIKAKVAKPKIPTPKAPKIKTLHVKVARPVIPQPRMPKLRNIPAPHVGRPSMAGVVSAVRSGMNQAVSAVRSGGNRMVAAVQSAVSAIMSEASSMQYAGQMMGAGLAAGIESSIPLVVAAATELASAADKATRVKAQVASPSKVFKKTGNFLGQGLAIGMRNTTGLVSAAGAGLIDAANTGGTVGVNYAGSGSITPASLTRSQVFSTRNNSSNNSRVVTIAKGAIVVNGSSKPQQTADEIMTAIEKRMVEIDNRRL